jgi:outer membrane lipoprotein-sorting protein
LGLLIALALLGNPSAGADESTTEDRQARSILEKADEIRFPSEGFQVDIDISNTASGQETEARKYRVLSKGPENTVVMILEPAAERGQIMLMKGRDLWIFMPNISQPIRLGLGQRLTGQVANGDLARTNFTGDYIPKILRTETLDGEPHYVLELLAVDRGVTYHRALLWVNKANHRPRKAEFYSLSNRLMKTCSYEGYQQAAGRQRPMRLVMEDALRAGERSILDYQNLKLRELPDKVFSKEYLKKLQE